VVVVALAVAAALVAAVATAAAALAAVATAAVLAVAATEDLGRDPADREPPVVRADRRPVGPAVLVTRVGLVTREPPVVRADRGLVDPATRVDLGTPADLVTREARVDLVVLVTLVVRVTPVSPVGLAARATPVDLRDITATMVTAGTGPTTPTSTTTISTATTASGAGSARGATTLAVASSMPHGVTDPRPGVRVRRRHRPGTNHFPRRVDSGPTAQSTTGGSTKRRLGTHSSTSGASTSSESGSRCRGSTLTREVARSL
jgi:hypothetical protein